MDIVMANFEALIRETEAKARQNGTYETDAFTKELNRSSYEDYVEFISKERK